MERLKKIWALALRKIGVSIHEYIFEIRVDDPAFSELLSGKRSAIITPWDPQYQIDSLVKVREFTPNLNGYTMREAHLFIAEMIRPDDTGCLLAGYCVLVLR